jgi:hypothetical protein
MNRRRTVSSAGDGAGESRYYLNLAAFVAALGAGSWPISQGRWKVIYAESKSFFGAGGTSDAGKATTTSTAIPQGSSGARGGRGVKVTKHPHSTSGARLVLKTNLSGLFPGTTITPGATGRMLTTRPINRVVGSGWFSCAAGVAFIIPVSKFQICL